jgi:ABC-2 type transport system ATP-binding protein
VSFKPLVVLLAATCVVGASCSSSTKSASSSASTTTTVAPSTTAVPAVPGGPYTPKICPAPLTGTPPVAATKVPGSTSDYDVTSFDGTKIRVHWFPLAKFPAGGTAPTLLKGPGWGESGDTDTTSNNFGLFGDLSISALRNAGYNVLTWDPRGFGKSGGTVETDSAQYEGRDVEQLISWVAQQPGVELDETGNPRMGMVGASYGGGIQLITAAIDCRVDAIVPQIAWHSLGTSLYPAQTVKSGWGNLLYSAAAGRPLDPHITSAWRAGNTTGVLTAEDQQWFIDRGPGDLVSKITVPTLIEQGTIDTLFPLEEGVTNYGILRADGVPTAMLWMCSGHGVCLTNPGAQNLAGQDALAWLNRYVKNDSKTKVGAPFEYVDQNGVEYTADQYPLPAAAPIVADGSGTLTMVAGGGAGPAHATGSVGALGTAALPITPGKATHAVNVPITATKAANVVGAPTLTLNYSGTTPAGARPTRVFAQLVDDSTGIVLGNQITPIAVTLDGKSHTTTVPLEIVAFTATPGSHLTLQLVATTVSYANPRLGGTVHFSSVHVALPTVTGVTRQVGSAAAVR